MTMIMNKALFGTREPVSSTMNVTDTKSELDHEASMPNFITMINMIMRHGTKHTHMHTLAMLNETDK